MLSRFYGCDFMSNDEDEDEDEDYSPPSRKEILKHINMAIQEAKSKVESGRVYDVENEKIRIRWIKALGYLANSYRQLIKDKDLEDLTERIEELEEEEKDDFKKRIN